MAQGAMLAVSEMGKKVPEDVSIVGFDKPPLSRFIYPSLTMVAQHIRNNGRFNS